jgi:putative component of membrane protein insertase Oxa1/YidC/SpoIIIJ protein YidD
MYILIENHNLGSFSMIRILIVIFFILYSIINIHAQYSSEIQSLKMKYMDKPEGAIIYNTKNSDDGLFLVANRLFNFYKKYISSQDHASCSFTPSCSEYALVSISEQGFLLGTMNSIDRLSRCNGRNKRHYHQDEITGLSIDEVRNHKYEKN